MRKLFLCMLAMVLLMAGGLALAENPAEDTTSSEDEIVEWVDLDEEEEIVEWVDLDDEEEIVEWVDLDAEEEEPAPLSPSVLCEIVSDTAYERRAPSDDAEVTGTHYKGEVLALVDISEDWWLLKNGNYIFIDDVKIANEEDIPGESESERAVDAYAGRDFRVAVAGIAMSKDDLVKEYHSLAIYDVFEKKIYCYKFGVETLEIDCSRATWVSPVFPAWTITNDFTEEGTGAIGVMEVMEMVFRYTEPGSVFVIFP